MVDSRFVRRAALGLALAGAVVLPPRARAQAPAITSPEKFFGHQLGADRQLARWDKIVEYYRLLERESPAVKVVDMGPSTLGNPFLLVIVSSPDNLVKLEDLRQINARLSDPRGVSDSDVRQLVAQGKAVVLQSMSLHATEVGGTQMAPELVYDLVSKTDEGTRRILDEVITLVMPSFNPDGQIMVTDWYRQTLGTEYEGVNYPSLYHTYTGHDNNRDAFQTNVVESQYMAKVMFREWIPQAYVDHHHMGSYGARIYVPPYAEPIRPAADPLVWREMSWYGAHVAYKEEEANLSGVVNAAIYSGWGHFGFHWITPFHNIAGMLTESASARLASPLFIHPDQLRGNTRGMPAYEEQTTFPNPWPGGWWRLRDIVERQKVSAWAVLDLAARNRETVLWNAYLKARRQTERGAAGSPTAYVIPAEQHDGLTAVTLVNKLLAQGIEVRRAPSEFVHEGRVYGAGSFVVPMAQPKMGVIRWLLGRTHYPDNSYTRDADGNPIRPYDMAADVMAEFMGVRVDPVDGTVPGTLEPVAATIEPLGSVTKGAFGYVLDGRLNAAFRAVNLLLDKGVAVRRVTASGAAGLRQGDFVVADAGGTVAQDVARATGVGFAPLAVNAQSATTPVRRLRVGMYQRFFGGNMDEGWTRWLLEQWGFPFTSLKDAEIKTGKLAAKYDVIILPADRTAAMTGEREPGGRGGQAADYPPEYRSGFGQEGVNALKAFVEEGGTLLTFGEGASLPIDKFELPLRNVVADLPSREFWCPGSTLRATYAAGHPLAFGMPEEGLAVFLAGSQAWEVVPTARNERVETIVRFPDRDLLRSGWLIGEQIIAKKAAMVSAQLGRGRVVLIGFRPQHRAQTHGTFKLVFNVLLGGAATP
jgi:hypothetical protein